MIQVVGVERADCVPTHEDDSVRYIAPTIESYQ